ncbi:hypothetical protein [Streptomyces lunaelactis]|uniref:hypothetical protein n=1 Tax=Streptomyces lunaelactis TaxID=1535768 RepID=UPI0015858E28|nr:hypothetical protein [Streptomyces lunaelactis]NUK24852.1 hypothetical protein [Streptomyces lunaelactis]
MVEAVHIGPTEDPEGAVRRQHLAAELWAAEAKLERQRKATAKTEQQVAEIAGTKGSGD